MCKINISITHPVNFAHGQFQCDVELDDSKVNWIIGNNGSGKSTFFQYLKQNPNILAKNVIFMDQSPVECLTNLTVVELITLILKEMNPSTTITSVDNFSLIDFFNFRSKMDTFVNHLSGGENQILKILLTFLFDSEWYFLDEPSNNLDIQNKEKFGKFLNSQLEVGKKLLIIDHDQGFMNQFRIHKFQLSGEEMITLKAIL